MKRRRRRRRPELYVILYRVCLVRCKFWLNSVINISGSKLKLLRLSYRILDFFVENEKLPNFTLTKITTI